MSVQSSGCAFIVQRCASIRSLGIAHQQPSDLITVRTNQTPHHGAILGALTNDRAACGSPPMLVLAALQVHIIPQVVSVSLSNRNKDLPRRPSAPHLYTPDLSNLSLLHLHTRSHIPADADAAIAPSIDHPPPASSVNGDSKPD